MNMESPSGIVKSRYALDNDWSQARERLKALEARHDPGTIRHLEALGVGEGWNCLEVGGGGGSTTEWLCRRVGLCGRVVATDINTRFLDALDFENLGVRVHNIVKDPVEQGAYDLVHARALLMHIAERDAALSRMVSALKPGGCLLLEEPDYISVVADPRTADADRELVLKVGRAAQAALGTDLFYGRRLYGDVCALGMVDVGAEGRVLMERGGTQAAQFWRLTAEQLREQFLGTGQVTADELDAYVALLDDPNFVWMGPTLVATWGRMP